MSFLLSLFGAIAAQRNTRDSVGAEAVPEEVVIR